MAVLMDEKEHAKKRKKFTILGIIFLIIGFGLFFGGPILAFTTGQFLFALISMPAFLFIVPGFIMLSLGTQRALAAFTAQSAGPVAVESAHDFGRPVAKEVTSGVKDGFTGENSEMYCKYCGNLIDGDSDFCKYCGKKLN
ncbi:MAG: zinc ribbon domain-containing protein [bacterium]|nr:zinc ribbon domain-containing protein [bacterium]